MRIGILADIQYSDEDDYQDCRYRASLAKLDEAVTFINSQDVDFVVQLGDLINRDFESYAPVLSRLESLMAPIFHVLGNHDFIVTDKQKYEITSTLNMAGKYYAFEQNHWSLLFLDGNDLSLNAHPEKSSAYTESERLFNNCDSDSEWWNGALSTRQLAWLEQQLTAAQQKGLNIGIFCHFPIFPENRFSLWNAAEVRAVIEKYDNVKFWMNGHHHVGSYAYENGIHHHSFKGMVESEPATYAVMDFALDKIVISGQGAESNKVLEL